MLEESLSAWAAIVVFMFQVLKPLVVSSLRSGEVHPRNGFDDARDSVKIPGATGPTTPSVNSARMTLAPKVSSRNGSAIISAVPRATRSAARHRWGSSWFAYGERAGVLE